MSQIPPGGAAWGRSPASSSWALAAPRRRSTCRLTLVSHGTLMSSIVDENKNYEQILNPAVAPEISVVAKTYGLATRFFAEVHPSEANDVALLGGDTFGIHDGWNSPRSELRGRDIS